MPLPDELVTIERTLWTNDRQIYDGRLDDDAILVFPETGVMHKAAALGGIEQENRAGRRWADVAFADVEAVAVTPDAALLTYRADARWEHESTIRSVLATSLYVRRNREWMLAFHQQSYPEGVKALAALPSLPRDIGRQRFSRGRRTCGSARRIRNRCDGRWGRCDRAPGGRRICRQTWSHPEVDDRPAARGHAARRPRSRRSRRAPVLKTGTHHRKKELLMIVVRNVFQLKFGKAREALAVMKEGVAIQKRLAAEGSARLLTDVTGRHYTLVLEMTLPNLAALEAMAPRIFGDKEFQANYQKMVPLVESGHREIFTIVE